MIAYLADQSEEYSAQCDGGALTTETIRRSPQVRALDRLRDCATLQELGGEFETRLIADVTLRGKSKSLPIYEVLSSAVQPARP